MCFVCLQPEFRLWVKNTHCRRMTQNESFLNDDKRFQALYITLNLKLLMCTYCYVGEIAEQTKNSNQHFSSGINGIVLLLGLCDRVLLLVKSSRFCDKTIWVGYSMYNVFHSDDVNGSKQKHSGVIKSPFTQSHFPSTPSIEVRGFFSSLFPLMPTVVALQMLAYERQKNRRRTAFLPIQAQHMWLLCLYCQWMLYLLCKQSKYSPCWMQTMMMRQT